MQIAIFTLALVLLFSDYLKINKGQEATSFLSMGLVTLSAWDINGVLGLGFAALFGSLLISGKLFAFIKSRRVE
jgi:hypothetical protein